MAADVRFDGPEPFRRLCGWDHGRARVAMRRLGSTIPRFAIEGPVKDYKGQRRMLWEYTRKVLGKDTPNYAQEIGDCFVAGTMVRMVDGSEKPIETIVPGDRVISHLGASRPVLRVIAKTHEGELIRLRSRGQPRSLTATPDHLMPVIAENSLTWLPLGSLQLKTKILVPYAAGLDDAPTDHTDLGFAAPIKHLSRHLARCRVYCLEVAEDHSFIANGYAVHNCVSFAGKNVLEHLSAVQISLNNEAQKWHPVFPSYFYGTSRVLVGHGQIGPSEDGSTGVWLQEAAKKYGVLAADEAGVPQYSGQVAKQWGASGPPDQFLKVGQTHPVKTTAIVTTAADAADAINNGYPCNVCSNQGFAMAPGADGFHQPQGNWGHAMTLIGFEDHPQHGLYFIILNSWGDVMGRCKDFTGGEDLPVGIIRARGNVVNAMLGLQDSFAFSAYDGYPDQTDKLDKALFDLVGD